MIYWAPFLHFYQPPTQFHSVLKKVCNESYRPLLSMMHEHPNAKLTINMCGVLTEMLNDHNASDIIDGIASLAKNKQLEFVDSAKYHPILPLIPEKEMRRQIQMNHTANAYFFKDLYKTQGFFSPEMCYSDTLASVLSSMSYRWILLSGVAAVPKWPLDTISRVAFGVNGIVVFFRDDIISNKISFHETDSQGFIEELINLSKDKKDIYVITAMDAETFGHHIQNWERLFLAEVYEMINGVTVHKDIKQRADLAATHKAVLSSKDSSKIKVVTISELLKIFPLVDSQPPKFSSWSTTHEEIEQANYYPLWQDKTNYIHELQWKHMNICFDLMDEASRLCKNDECKRYHSLGRALLDRAIHSCQFWWANKHRGMWDINLINKGLMLQEEAALNAFKSIKTSERSDEAKTELYYKVVAGRDLANKIRDELFGVKEG